MSQEDFQNLPNSVTGFGNILLAGEDASLLAENYLRPSVKGLVSGMNSGWYSTAKTHKKFGFDITFGLNSSLIPSKDISPRSALHLAYIRTPPSGINVESTVG